VLSSALPDLTGGTAVAVSDVHVLDIKLSAADGDAFDVERFTLKSVQFAGTVTGTTVLRLESTVDGVDWIEEGADITAGTQLPLVRDILGFRKRIRVKTVAFDTGAPKATFGGLDPV
jgi:hypothetical protein